MDIVFVVASQNDQTSLSRKVLAIYWLLVLCDLWFCFVETIKKIDYHATIVLWTVGNLSFLKFTCPSVSLTVIFLSEIASPQLLLKLQMLQLYLLTTAHWISFENTNLAANCIRIKPNGCNNLAKNTNVISIFQVPEVFPQCPLEISSEIQNQKN